jgi:Uma2 family endonuclease
MNVAVVSPPEIETLADLLHRLGDIPLERIRFRPYPGTATEQDVIEAEARTDRLCELVDGVLVEKAMGYYESRLAVILIHFLESYLDGNALGIVLGADGMTRMEPGLVRMPDVAFHSWAHFPNRLLPPGSFVEQAPDLAVEILSPSNTKREMDRKRAEYFAGGSHLVWQVYPPSRRVRVYTSVDAFVELTDEETLDGGAVLPGFTLSIRRWFERAGQRSTEESE